MQRLFLPFLVIGIIAFWLLSLLKNFLTRIIQPGHGCIDLHRKAKAQAFVSNMMNSSFQRSISFTMTNTTLRIFMRKVLKLTELLPSSIKNNPNSSYVRRFPDQIIDRSAKLVFSFFSVFCGLWLTCCCSSSLMCCSQTY